MGSVMLQHLPSAWHVDQAIITEERRIVCLRFGSDADPACMDMDEKLYKIVEKVKDWVVIYLVDNQVCFILVLSLPRSFPTNHSFLSIVAYRICLLCASTNQLTSLRITQLVPDFNAMYEIYDPCTVMFFWRNKHIQVDFGTGNNNKINFPISDKQELVDILETVYRGASKGKGLVVSPRDYSTRWAY